LMLVDTVSGNVIYSKNEDSQIYPASLTKIMTVLLAIEAVERGEVALTDYVTASGNISYDLIDDGSTAGIVAGETMTLENLLYCAMIASANEACNIIAEHISGSIPSFVERMNTRAAELGCTGTNFANTHGLPNSNHYTTASDFSLIAMAAVSNPLFMQICNTVSWVIPATNESDERVLSNTNGLINKDSTHYPGYYYEPAAGVKTGYTDAAGYCLISTATKNGMTFLGVVMGAKATDKGGGNFEFGHFSESIKLYNWVFDNYSYRDILKITALVAEVPVEMGSDAGLVSLHPQSAVKALLPNDEDIESYEQKITIYSQEEGKELYAPVEAGEVLGEITIERDGIIYGSSQLVASSSVSLSYGKYIKSQIGKTLKNPIVIIAIIIVLALFFSYVYLVVRYNTRKRKHMQELSRRRRVNLYEPERPSDPVRSALSRKSAAISARQESFVEDLVEEIPLPEEISEGETESQAERDYFEEFFGKK
ncbi:MAG: D-alanyl-D-alanine carboxypeptidase, partial [Clostridiales bacterium]|nr:D-alanyl-D-alanine carboxypeptidase [Clostridiales bacterium]